MRVVQCDFQYLSDTGIVKQTAWVDVAWRLKVGSRVSFKGDDPTIWIVTCVGLNVVEISDIHNTWEIGGNTESTARKEQ